MHWSDFFAADFDVTAQCPRPFQCHRLNNVCRGLDRTCSEKEQYLENNTLHQVKHQPKQSGNIEYTIGFASHSGVQTVCLRLFHSFLHVFEDSMIRFDGPWASLLEEHFLPPHFAAPLELRPRPPASALQAVVSSPLA